MAEVTAVSQANQGAGESNNLKSPKAVQIVGRALDLLFAGTGYLAGGLYVVLAFFVTYDALARKWGSYVGLPTTRVTDEISGYMLALAATWGFAYALRTDAHVRVDVLFPYMGRRLKTAMDFIALMLMALFASLISWKIWALVVDSMQSGMRSSTYLLTPLYIPQGILGVGFSLLALAAVFMALALLAGWKLPARAPGLEHPAEPPGNI
ncbi:MAG: TRAP transporter small permease [Nitrospinae bacterium]|nr:TRAP transporter small permease [Nitrospinota bacterium]